MPDPGEYATSVNDMYDVHSSITGALDQADELVASADTPERVEVIDSFHDHVLERIDHQHELLKTSMDQARATISAGAPTRRPRKPRPS